MNAKLALLCALSLLTTRSNLSAADAQLTNITPLICICTTGGYPKPLLDPAETNYNSNPLLVAAIWNDGKIVWSKDTITGRPPYFQSEVERAKLDALITSLESQGTFTNTALERPWFGPDSQTTRIVIHSGNHQLRMESWHELYEENTNVVATARGLTSLNGRNRKTVLEEQPADYQQFRKTWTEIRDTVSKLIPAEGKPYVDSKERWCSDR